MGTYCTPAQVGQFLRVTFSGSTTPTDTVVDAFIARKEAEIERRTGHAWQTKTVTNEFHTLPLVYSYGSGLFIPLHHRMIKTIDYAQGDRIEIYNGQDDTYTDITADTSQWRIIKEYGELYLRGYIFTIFRDSRVRLTYRYGETTVPKDIEEACIKLVAADLLQSAFRMDILPNSSNGPRIQDAVDQWKKDVDFIIQQRQEVHSVMR